MTMTNGMWACLLFMLALVNVVLAFRPILRTFPLFKSRLVAMSSSNNDDQDMERKMELVRSLQSAYYQSSTVEPTVLERDTGIMRNLPLWRVQWTELPGRSNVLNVHEGIYTNMYETILRGPKPWYVGHLYLPGGSKNIKNSERRFQLKTWEMEVKDDERESDEERSAVVGTLLRISDFRRLEDGRLILLVQGLERFVVFDCVQTLPYSIANVQILPDFEKAPEKEEEEARAKRSAAVMESFRFHDYEYDVNFELPLEDSKYLSHADIWGPDIAKVLPFVPYSKKLEPSQLKPPVDCVESEESEDVLLLSKSSLESRLLEGGILSPPEALTEDRAALSVDELEDQVWTALENFCRASRIILPDEVLCLLPPGRSWIVPVPVERISSEYPSQRRQRRLSFAAPALLERTRVGEDMRQVWLETPGTKARLR